MPRCKTTFLLLILLVLTPTMVFAGTCSGDQINKMMSAGFTKAEIMKLCGRGSQPPSIREAGKPPQAKRSTSQDPLAGMWKTHSSRWNKDLGVPLDFHNFWKVDQRENIYNILECQDKRDFQYPDTPVHGACRRTIAKIISFNFPSLKFKQRHTDGDITIYTLTFDGQYKATGSYIHEFSGIQGPFNSKPKPGKWYMGRIDVVPDDF